jgi:hypothetical protein
VHRELARVRADSDSAAAASRRQLARMTQRLADIEKSRREPGTPVHGSAAPKTPWSSNAYATAWQQNLERVQRDPTYQAMMRRQTEENLETNYSDLLATLHLPPATLAKLKKLMAERMESGPDAQAAAKDLGLASDPQAVAQAARQASDEINHEINALLGDADYAKLNDFATLQGPLRGVREQYLGDLAYAGMPLEPDQAIALARVVRDLWDPNTTTDSIALRNRVIDPQTGYTAIDQELLNRSAGLLTPDQLAVVKASQTAIRYRNQMYQNLAKAAAAAAAGNP